MRSVRAIYDRMTQVEEALAAAAFVGIVALVFAGAIARYLEHPLNWTQDVSLLLMAWGVFLAADVALRTVGFIKVDFLFERFPHGLQRILTIVFGVGALVFLGIIAYFGLQLAMSNMARQYGTLGISYFWAALSAPVGAALLAITMIKQLLDPQDRTLVENQAKEVI